MTNIRFLLTLATIIDRLQVGYKNKEKIPHKYSYKKQNRYHQDLRSAYSANKWEDQRKRQTECEAVRVLAAGTQCEDLRDSRLHHCVPRQGIHGETQIYSDEQLPIQPLRGLWKLGKKSSSTDRRRPRLKVMLDLLALRSRTTSHGSSIISSCWANLQDIHKS